MNPVFSAAVGSILRHFLTMVATALVTRGIWTPEDSSTYVAAAALAIISLGWAMYQKYAAHSKVIEALSAPVGTTIEDLNRK